MQDLNVTSKTPIDLIPEETKETEIEREAEAMEEEVPPQEELIEQDQGSKNKLLRFLSFLRAQHYVIRQVFGPKFFLFKIKLLKEEVNESEDIGNNAFKSSKSHVPSTKDEQKASQSESFLNKTVSGGGDTQLPS